MINLQSYAPEDKIPQNLSSTSVYALDFFISNDLLQKKQICIPTLRQNT